MVGHRDRAQADVDARSPAARRPASRSRWSGRCACAGRLRSACAWRAAPAPRAAGPDRGAARPAGRRSPRPRRPRATRRARRASLRPCSAQARAQRAGRATSRSSCCGEHVDVAGLEVQADVAVGAGSPRRPARARRAARHRRRAPAPARPGAVTCPSEAATTTSAPRERRVLVVDDRDAVAQAGAQRRDGARPGVDDRLPRQLLREPAQRAQEQPQRAALLAVGEDDPQRARPRRARRAHRTSRPGAAARRRRGSSASAASAVAS